MEKQKIQLLGVGYGRESIEELEKMYNYYNKTLFNNELPLYTIEWNKRTYRRLGSCDVVTRVIELSYKHHKVNDNKELLNTLLHEMIHAYTYHKYQKLDHGETFRHEYERINKLLGLNVSTHGHEENANFVKTTRTIYMHECEVCFATFTRYKNMEKNYRCQCGGKIKVVGKKKVND